jgi:phosphoesterase RecJ-like protein
MLENVRKGILQSEHPLILGHINPDADCIGGMLALNRVLRRMGKRSEILLPHETVSGKTSFLLKLATLESQLPDEKVISQSDLLIVLDTALERRINKPKELTLPKRPICNIDHHPSNERFGTFNWVDPQAASTSQMVYHLLRALGQTPDSIEATLLYAGLHADTLGFSLNTTNVEALETAAELSRCGANVGWVCQNLYRSMRLSDFKLIQIVYDNTNVSPCGRFAWSTVREKEFLSAGARPSDIDDQVSIPRSIDGVKIAALFSETRSHKTRINLRAEDDVNLLPLANYFGGGGHAQSAGVIQEGDFDAIIETVKKLTIEFLDNPSAFTVNHSENAHVK